MMLAAEQEKLKPGIRSSKREWDRKNQIGKAATLNFCCMFNQVRTVASLKSHLYEVPLSSHQKQHKVKIDISIFAISKILQILRQQL